MRQDVPSGWIHADNSLTRTIKRADFVDALGFVLEIGRLAEKADHHPDIRIHHYRQVQLDLCTHSAGNTVTDRDFALAQKINDLSEEAVRLSREELQNRFKV